MQRFKRIIHLNVLKARVNVNCGLKDGQMDGKPKAGATMKSLKLIPSLKFNRQMRKCLVIFMLFFLHHISRIRIIGMIRG